MRSAGAELPPTHSAGARARRRAAYNWAPRRSCGEGTSSGRPGQKVVSKYTRYMYNDDPLRQVSKLTYSWQKGMGGTTADSLQSAPAVSEQVSPAIYSDLCHI